MTGSGGEQRARITQVALLGSEALEMSQVVKEHASKAERIARQVSAELNTARNSAIAEINKIDDMLTILRSIIAGSQSFEVFQALSQFELAREKLSQYTNILKYQIERIDAIAVVLRLGMASEHLLEASAAFVTGLENLRVYSEGL